jgi:hypothetical protein
MVGIYIGDGAEMELFDESNRQLEVRFAAGTSVA